MIIDTHSHYDDKAFDADRDEILNSLAEGGISRVVNIGADLQSSRATAELTQKYKFLYGAVGVHPEGIKELDESGMELLRELARLPKIVMIGEIGLDYYWEKENREQQIYWYRRQLALAAQLSLPVCIHSRDAAKDTIEVLEDEIKQAETRGQKLTGIIHCFSYGTEMAERFIRLGFYFGIGGVVTFKNAKTLKSVVEMLPAERILLETDCPYLAPEPCRGKRNSSLHLPYVAEAVAALRQTDAETVIRQTEKNAQQLLGLA